MKEFYDLKLAIFEAWKIPQIAKWLTKPEVTIGKWRIFIDWPWIKAERKF